MDCSFYKRRTMRDQAKGKKGPCQITNSRRRYWAADARGNCKATCGLCKGKEPSHCKATLNKQWRKFKKSTKIHAQHWLMFTWRVQDNLVANQLLGFGKCKKTKKKQIPNANCHESPWTNDPKKRKKTKMLLKKGLVGLLRYKFRLWRTLTKKYKKKKNWKKINKLNGIKCTAIKSRVSTRIETRRHLEASHRAVGNKVRVEGGVSMDEKIYTITKGGVENVAVHANGKETDMMDFAYGSKVLVCTTMRAKSCKPQYRCFVAKKITTARVRFAEGVKGAQRCLWQSGGWRKVKSVERSDAGAKSSLGF